MQVGVPLPRSAGRLPWHLLPIAHDPIKAQGVDTRLIAKSWSQRLDSVHAETLQDDQPNLRQDHSSNRPAEPRCSVAAAAVADAMVVDGRFDDMVAFVLPPDENPRAFRLFRIECRRTG
jgi:hypothetical protein